MRNLFVVLLIILFASVGSSIACEGPQCETQVASDVEAGMYTDTINNWNYSHNPNQEDFAQNFGATGHAYDVEAMGTKTAYAHGEGDSNIVGYGGAFQKEIKGGELSGAGALTIGTSEASGHAIGTDYADCSNGEDTAKVDLEVFGYVAQANGAYSDDRDSWVGGGNMSDVDFYGHTDSADYGANHYWTLEPYGRWWYKQNGSKSGWYIKPFNWHPQPNDKNEWFPGRYAYRYKLNEDLEAEASDSIFGMGIAGGGTLVYAKQTKNKALVAGVTAGFSTATFNGAEETEVNVSGNGAMTGVANLPNGYTAFNGTYSYDGQNFGAGITGGMATMQKENTGNSASITSSATSFSAAICDGCSGHDVD
jgi:hypothetical protein